MTRLWADGFESVVNRVNLIKRTELETLITFYLTTKYQYNDGGKIVRLILDDDGDLVIHSEVPKKERVILTNSQGQEYCNSPVCTNPRCVAERNK